LGVNFADYFCYFHFRSPGGHKFFLFINDLVVKVLDSASAGAKFLFGRLAISPGEVNEHGEPSLGFF
jgi:concentrative nucleoside transporter, CNT family